MRGVAHVWPESPRRVGDVLEVAARVEWPWRMKRCWKGRRQRLWIRVPGDLEVTETAVADAVLLGLVAGAMCRVRELRLHATATQDLVENLTRLSVEASARQPDENVALVLHCDGLATATPPSGPAILCFSGGLDSAYSLWRHTESNARSNGVRLGTAVMLHGADIPVEETTGFAAAFARARRMTDARHVPLVAATTNLRHVRQDWSTNYRPTLAAVLNLFRGSHGTGLIATAVSSHEAPTWCPEDVAHPPLVSSRAFPIEGDGYEADRFDKFDAIRAWPEAMEDLRVCYRRGSWSTNCGECLKCQSLGFIARLSIGTVPPCLPRAMTEADVRAFASAPDPNVRLRLSQILMHARARGIDAPWVAEIERALRASDAPHPAGG